jgi:RecB family exonuclease
MIKSLSYSAIQLFNECPAKFAKIYLDKDPRPVVEATIEGSLVHDVLEEWMKDRTKCFKKIAKEVTLTKSDKYSDLLSYRVMTHDQFAGAIELLTEFSKRDDLNVKTVHYEFPFNVVLPNGIPVAGRIDRIDDEGEYYNLVDYKTTKLFVYKNDVDVSLQGAMYVLVCKMLFPSKKFKFTIDPLRFKPITTEFSDQFLNSMLDYIEIKWNEIAKLDAKKAEYRINRYCGYCQYRDVCPAIKKMATNIYGEKKDIPLEEICGNIIEIEDKVNSMTKIKDAMTKTLTKHLEYSGKKSLDFKDCYAFIKANANGSKLKCIKKESKNDETTNTDNV